MDQAVKKIVVRAFEDVDLGLNVQALLSLISEKEIYEKCGHLVVDAIDKCTEILSE